MRALSEYKNYRVYLKEYYHYKKSNNHCYSYRLFSRLAKIRAANYMKLVMDGQRNLTQESAWKFSEALQHSEEEREIFMDLVKKNQNGWPIRRGIPVETPIL